MSEKVRWRFVPDTPLRCVLNLVIGLALVVQAVIVLATTVVQVPALEVLVAICGSALVVAALVGFISLRSRGK